MTLFEYLSVAVSILLSLGMVHILSRIKDILEGGRVYWIHAVHVGLILSLHPVYWWMFWGYRDVSWTLPFFLIALVPPSLICVLATSLVPRDSSAISSWRDHYFRIHRFFFGLYAAFVVSVATQSVLLRGEAITAHLRFRGGATRTLTLPLPSPAWKLLRTSVEVVAEVDQLLDRYIHAEIAGLPQPARLSVGRWRSLPSHQHLANRAGVRPQASLRPQESRKRSLCKISRTCCRSAAGRARGGEG